MGLSLRAKEGCCLLQRADEPDTWLLTFSRGTRPRDQSKRLKFDDDQTSNIQVSLHQLLNEHGVGVVIVRRVPEPWGKTVRWTEGFRIVILDEDESALETGWKLVVEELNRLYLDFDRFYPNIGS